MFGHFELDPVRPVFVLQFPETIEPQNINPYEPRHEKICICHMRTTKAHPQSDQHF